MKFKVGDKVRVRSWDEMEREFGIGYLEEIKTPTRSFVKDMKHICGQTLTIENVLPDRYEVLEYGWEFTDEMFEKIPVDYLENGRFCRDRNGDIYVWLFGQLFANDEIIAEFCFNDDLTSQSCRDLDIMEIRQPIPRIAFNINELFANFDKMELIWKREPEAKDKAIEMLNDVISDCEKSIEESKSVIENARQTIRQIEEGDLDALL